MTIEKAIEIQEDMGEGRIDEFTSTELREAAAMGIGALRQCQRFRELRPERHLLPGETEE